MDDTDIVLNKVFDKGWSGAVGRVADTEQVVDVGAPDVDLAVRGDGGGVVPTAANLDRSRAIGQLNQHGGLGFQHSIPNDRLTNPTAAPRIQLSILGTHQRVFIPTAQ